jgi:RNA polymerase subunit RPABC4/transcription elongation factor Spt4
MQCQFCGAILPDNSEYCLHCGKQTPMSTVDSSDLVPNTNEPALMEESSNQPVEADMATRKEKTSRYCKHCGGEVDLFSHTCASCGEKAAIFSLKNFILIILVILLVAAISAFVIQRFTFSAKENQYLSEINDKNQEISQREQEIYELETDIGSKNTNIQSLNDQIRELKVQIADYEADSEVLNTIIDFLKSSNAGYASSKFKASDKIFVVEKFDTHTSFTLTASFSNGATISTSEKGTAASIVFSQNEWYGPTTTLYIKPKKVGTTIVTFSNDQSTQTFRILIVVID